MSAFPTDVVGSKRARGLARRTRRDDSHGSLSLLVCAVRTGATTSTRALHSDKEKTTELDSHSPVPLGPMDVELLPARERDVVDLVRAFGLLHDLSDVLDGLLKLGRLILLFLRGGRVIERLNGLLLPVLERGGFVDRG
jgi:hypothetical protein